MMIRTIKYRCFTLLHFPQLSFSKNEFRWFFNALCLFMFLSAPANAIELLSVQPSELPNKQVQIQFTFSAPVAAPKDFSIQSPSRILLDFPNVTSKLERKTIAIGIGVVHSLVAITAPVDGSDRTRVVLNLTDALPYTVSNAGERVTITINPITAASLPAVTPPIEITTSRSNTIPTPIENSTGATVRKIDFRRIDKKIEEGKFSGQFEIYLTNSKTQSFMHQEDESSPCFVEIYDATPRLPNSVYKELDVIDFGTPVTTIKPHIEKNKVVFEIKTSGDASCTFQPGKGNPLILSIISITTAEKEEIARNKIIYKGERVNFSFQNIETRAALKLFANFTDMNLIVSDNVKGNITLELHNLPWDEALDNILETQELAKRQEGNVIMIDTIDAFKIRNDRQIESMKQEEQLSRLVTKFFHMRFAKAADIATFLQGGGKKTDVVARTRETENTRGGEGFAMEDTSVNFSQKNMLSKRGIATADIRTNTLVVTDTIEQFDKVIYRVIEELDKSIQQVMIESRVVIANNNFARDLGVRFGVSGSMGAVGKNELMVTGGQNGNLAVGGFDKGPFGLNLDTGAPYNSGLIDANDNQTLITNLPVLEPSGSVNFLIGKIGSYLLQLELSAMQREGRGEIVSSPRVITSDQTPAVIEVGKDIPVTTPGSANSPPTVTYRAATLKLDVTPHITPDNQIIMNLTINKDEPDFSYTVQGNPLINKRSVTTSVLVDNGETVVLGGVFEREKSFSKEQVPWLGDIPVLGRLFKNEARLDNNNELLIFVTPKILKDSMAKTGK